MPLYVKHDANGKITGTVETDVAASVTDLAPGESLAGPFGEVPPKGATLVNGQIVVQKDEAPASDDKTPPKGRSGAST